MPVPEALAVLGTSAGLLGFLVSTLDRLVTFATTVREAKIILRGHAFQLHVVLVKLRQWEEQWVPDTQPSRAPWLWGEEGAAAIMQYKDTIYELVEETVRLVYHPGRFANAHEERQWHTILDASARSSVARNPASLSPDIMRKAALALWENTQLKEHVSALRNNVQDLESLAETAYGLAHPPKYLSSSSSTNRSRDQAWTLQQRHESALHVMQKLFQELECEEENFALLMTLPSDPETCRLDGEEHLQVDLLQSQEEFSATERCYCISLPFCIDWDKTKEAQRIVERVRSEPLDNYFEGQLSEDLRAELDRISNIHNEQAQYSHGTRLLRSRVALCLAVWGTLIWQTCWFKELCSCGLRIARIGVDGSPAFRRRHGCAQNHRCCAKDVSDRFHLLLGTLLAELVLLRPIRYVHDRASGRHFQVQMAAGKIEYVTRERLKDMLYESSNRSPGLARAIEHCLIFDESFSPQHPLLRPERSSDFLIMYVEKVVKPLARYYNAVRESHESESAIYQHAERWSFLWRPQGAAESVAEGFVASH